MKKKLILLAGAFMAIMSLNAQKVYNLYPGKTPGMENTNSKETVIKAFNGELTEVVNVTKPTLTVYQPAKDKNTGAAMIVFPGGAFISLSVINEGEAQAKYLAEHGVTAFVLKYRLVHMNGNTPDELLKSTLDVTKNLSAEPHLLSHDGGDEALRTIHGAFDDGRAAISFVRRHATEWGVDPNRIGIMGFSAGAQLVGQVIQHHTEESKPNMAAMIYGAQLREKASDPIPTITVPTDAAPLFICSPEEDLFSPDEILCVYKAWRAKQLPTELHFFPYVHHGFANREGTTGVKAWHSLLLQFMKDCKMIK